MDQAHVIQLLGSLASGPRLDIYRLLVRQGPGGMVAGEIGGALGMAPTNLSFHLKALTQTGLLTVTQEGRYQRYRAHLPLMEDVIAYLTEECCAGHPEACTGWRPAVACAAPPSVPEASPMPNPLLHDSTLNVLFLCTHNSARSILAEALLNHLAPERFTAWSAGSHPGSAPHPLALEVLESAGVATTGLRSKSWDEFAGDGAPRMDLVITVCDNAAGEVCPYWPGQPATAHWGYADPSQADGTPGQQREAFRHTMLAIKRRLELLVALPPGKLARTLLQDSVRALAGR